MALPGESGLVPNEIVVPAGTPLADKLTAVEKLFNEPVFKLVTQPIPPHITTGAGLLNTNSDVGEF